jgi:hypothetical protein
VSLINVPSFQTYCQMSTVLRMAEHILVKSTLFLAISIPSNVNSVFAHDIIHLGQIDRYQYPALIQYFRYCDHTIPTCQYFLRRELRCEITSPINEKSCRTLAIITIYGGSCPTFDSIWQNLGDSEYMYSNAKMYVGVHTRCLYNWIRSNFVVRL